MRIRGCLTSLFVFLIRAALFIGLGVAIYLLARNAIGGIRDLQARRERDAIVATMRAVIPPTATALQEGRYLIPTPTPEAATPTPLSVLPVPPAKVISAHDAPPQSQDPSSLLFLPTNTPRVRRTPDQPTLVATQIPENGPTLPAPTSTLPPVAARDTCTDKPQVTAVPTRAPRLRAEGSDVMNIVLLGSDADVQPADPSFRTDTIVIVSINRTVGSVAMLSIPRDLYVCIPQLGMQRINVAYGWGESVGWTPGGGFGLLQETLLYNFGIPVHFYARVSFTGFRALVDTLGGINVAVDCPLADQLRFTGEYNAEQTPVYAPFTLDVGYYRMDGSLALWYARMRTRLSDFDRNRRQQQVLRAIWREARDQGILQRAPQLFNEALQYVNTNLSIADIVGLLPIALDLTPEKLTSYQLISGRETTGFTTPAGEAVQIPLPAMFGTLREFYTPPSANRLTREIGTIEIVNGSVRENYDKVAADTLGWAGFAAIAAGNGESSEKTVVYDFTGSANPEAVKLMLKTLNIRADRVVSQPDPNRTVDFRVILGMDYVSCSAPGFGTAVN
ncbi:MAG: hypothetical protein OHK0023_21540 [Anaerolineae bacterium]